jgi:hypothetical protein
METDSRWYAKINLIKGIAVFIIPFALYFVSLNFLNQQHSICLFKNIFGKECYGCGITRAVISVIQFNFTAAWHYNKLVVAVFPLLLYLWAKYLLQIFKKLRQKNI